MNIKIDAVKIAVDFEYEIIFITTASIACIYDSVHYISKIDILFPDFIFTYFEICFPAYCVLIYRKQSVIFFTFFSYIFDSFKRFFFRSFFFYSILYCCNCVFNFFCSIIFILLSRAGKICKSNQAQNTK